MLHTGPYSCTMNKQLNRLYSIRTQGRTGHLAYRNITETTAWPGQTEGLETNWTRMHGMHVIANTYAGNAMMAPLAHVLAMLALHCGVYVVLRNSVAELDCNTCSHRPQAKESKEITFITEH